MLQKKGENEERGERTGIREMEVEERGKRERTPTQAAYCHTSGDEPGRPVTTYL